MVSINMREMLEAGVHFGHQVRRWNPKMKPYIYGKKNGIYIINLQTSIEMFKDALQFVTDTVARGGQAMIVGTKKQAQSIIEELSEQTGLHYVNKRWLGGLLTNFPMIKKSIDKLIDLDEMKRDGRWDVKSKKEQSRLEKVYKKLYKNLWGLRNLRQLPSVVIVVDAIYEDIAISEARKLGIPLVAIVDTNANPEVIDYPIPGNDDAIRSIRLFVSKFGEAVQEGMNLYEEGQMTPVSEEAASEHEALDSDGAPETGTRVSETEASDTETPEPIEKEK
ncbi:MAG TPA: 30S ribosomal protein S2 [Candidatus Aminicenantes bacterium]|nr:30S ribosomal protein S2 [Candidatus Aminicenantes bacterium]